MLVQSKSEWSKFEEERRERAFGDLNSGIQRTGGKPIFFFFLKEKNFSISKAAS